MKKKPERKGSILLLTLVITMIILVSVVTLGTVIVGSLGRSQVQANSIVAYYAAESVAERSLYDYKRGFKTPKEVRDDITALCTGGLGSSFPLMNSDVSLYCNAVVDQQTSINLGTIKKNNSRQFDIVDPTGTSKASGVSEISILCTGSTTFVEVTRTLLLTNLSGNSYGVNPAETKKAFFSCTNTPFSILIDENSSWSVRVKAFYGDATGVTVTAYDDSNPKNQKYINDYFTINISADYTSFSRQNLKIEVPGRISAVPFLDYVIYSESNLTKDLSPTGS